MIYADSFIFFIITANWLRIENNFRSKKVQLIFIVRNMQKKIVNYILSENK